MLFGISLLHIKSAFLFVMSHTLAISFRSCAGGKNEHNGGRQDQA